MLAGGELGGGDRGGKRAGEPSLRADGRIAGGGVAAAESERAGEPGGCFGERSRADPGESVCACFGRDLLVVDKLFWRRSGVAGCVDDSDGGWVVHQRWDAQQQDGRYERRLGGAGCRRRGGTPA